MIIFLVVGDTMRISEGEVTLVNQGLFFGLFILLGM